MEKIGFWFFDKNLGKPKVILIILWMLVIKMGWSFRSWDPKICCISRMNRGIGLIFCMLIQIYES